MHHPFIRHCIELAEHGRGAVSPNPLVGCSIVKEGAMITEGWHEQFGSTHAEVIALRKAGELAKGATLYVNLEPCCTQGKQPPCTSAIIEAGIQTVVFGARDPSNCGSKVLKESGIEVIGPVMEAECRRHNRGFFSLIEHGRPWVTIKKALTKDGEVAQERVTSEDQDRWSHQKLRATHDAILVGSGTVIADNPQLTTRFGFSSSPRRVILDPRGEVPEDATVMTDEGAKKTLVIEEKLGMPELLQRLKNEGISSVLVEGGPSVWGSFEGSRCIDEKVILRKK